MIKFCRGLHLYLANDAKVASSLKKHKNFQIMVHGCSTSVTAVLCIAYESILNSADRQSCCSSTICEPSCHLPRTAEDAWIKLPTFTATCYRIGYLPYQASVLLNTALPASYYALTHCRNCAYAGDHDRFGNAVFQDKYRDIMQVQ